MLRTSTIGIALLWLLVLLPTCSCDTEPDEARHWFEFQPATTKAEVAEAAPPAVAEAAPPAVAEAAPPAVGDAAAVSPVTTTTSSLLNDTDKNDETKPEGDSKDTDVIEPDSQVDLDVEPTEAPALTTTPKVQLSQTKEPYCETLSNGTELCDERCEGGQLKCLNGGVCVVDDDRVETCRCPEDSDFTGPHCENRARIPIYSPSASCDGRLFLIILVTACIIIAVLIIINIITVIHLRRERPRGRKERDLQFSVRCPDSNQGSEGEMRARSNNLYFEAAGFNSCSSVDETSTIRSEDTESTTTYSAPVHENIYAVVNDGFRLQRPSLLLNNSTTTRA